MNNPDDVLSTVGSPGRNYCPQSHGFDLCRELKSLVSPSASPGTGIEENSIHTAGIKVHYFNRE